MKNGTSRVRKPSTCIRIRALHPARSFLATALVLAVKGDELHPAVGAIQRSCNFQHLRRSLAAKQESILSGDDPGSRMNRSAQRRAIQIERLIEFRVQDHARRLKHVVRWNAKLAGLMGGALRSADYQTGPGPR